MLCECLLFPLLSPRAKLQVKLSDEWLGPLARSKIKRHVKSVKATISWIKKGEGRRRLAFLRSSYVCPNAD